MSPSPRSVHPLEKLTWRRCPSVHHVVPSPGPVVARRVAVVARRVAVVPGMCGAVERRAGRRRRAVLGGGGGGGGRRAVVFHQGEHHAVRYRLESGDRLLVGDVCQRPLTPLKDRNNNSSSVTLADIETVIIMQLLSTAEMRSKIKIASVTEF